MPVRSGLMCIIVKLKSNVVVCTYKSQNNVKSHCVILIVHSDFSYSYIFSWVGAVQTTSPAPRRPRNNSVVTMIHCLPSANYRCVAKQHTYRAQAVAGISDGFPKENGGVSRQDRVAICRRQIVQLLPPCFKITKLCFGILDRVNTSRM